MREVLAYARADGENLVHGRVDSRHARFVAELIAHERDDLLDVCGNIVGPVRTRDPEKSSSSDR